MVTIEEVAKRIKSGAEKYGWSNNDYDWKPKTLTHYDVPEFCIKVFMSDEVTSAIFLSPKSFFK